MTWIKENWLAAVIAVGIVLSLAYIKVDGAHRDAQDRQASIVGCERSGAQKALNAAGWIRAASARRADGNKSAAAYYEGIADGTILTIPSPNEQMRGSRELAQVEVKMIAGRERYVLTLRSAKLQHDGCVRAYVA